MGAGPPVQGAQDGGQAVAVEAVLFLAHPGDLVPVLLPRLQGSCCQVKYLFIQDAPVPGDRHIPAQHPGQPQQVVGDAGAHPGPLGRVPPVLHVPLLKLPGGAQQELFPCPFRPGIQQGRRVLELVPEAEGPAILVLAGAGHETAGDHLIETPAAEITVQGAVRCADCKGSYLVSPPGQGTLLL